MMRFSACLSMLSCAAAPLAQPAWAVSSGLDLVETDVLRRINVEREAAGLTVLLEDLGLNAAAKAHSLDMASHPCFDHDSCDGTPWATRIAAHYPPATALGEIIAAGFAMPADVMDAWMKSPDHRADILGPAFKVAGVGYVESDPGAPYVTYWTVDFGGAITDLTVPSVVPEPGNALLMSLGLAGLLLAWRTQRTY